MLTLMSEMFHLLFVNIPFNNNVNLDSPIYYIVSQFGLLTFFPAIVVFLLIDKKRKSSKAIAFGLIVWNIKELYDEVCYLAKINNNVLEFNTGLCGQIVFILVVIFGSALLYSKFRS
jgi:hypothetical protein